MGWSIAVSWLSNRALGDSRDGVDLRSVGDDTNLAVAKLGDDKNLAVADNLGIFQRSLGCV